MKTMAKKFLETYDYLPDYDLMDMAFADCIEYTKGSTSVCLIKSFWFEDQSKLVCSMAGGCDWHFEAQ